MIVDPNSDSKLLEAAAVVVNEPPILPEFTTYDAEYSVHGGNIVSHDPHLNRDGEALYRFLLSQSQSPPSIIVRCKGIHVERKGRLATDNISGPLSLGRVVGAPEIVIDFDFRIDIGQYIIPNPVHWSVADNEPAYRGLMAHQVDTPRGRRNVSGLELDAFKSRRKEQLRKGIPPWKAPMNPSLDEANALKSSKSIRQWADDYCASDAYLKEFVYKKVVYGWDMQALKAAILSAIKPHHQYGSISVDFEYANTKILVCADNNLARTLSNPWLKALSIVFLVFPFVWLFKRFNDQGGGQWKVCGGAYALKRLETDASPAGSSSGGTSRTLSGTPRLVGMREGEWFRQWEDTITKRVIANYQDRIPLTNPDGYPSREVLRLDGYVETASRDPQSINQSYT